MQFVGREQIWRLKEEQRDREEESEAARSLSAACDRCRSSLFHWLYMHPPSLRLSLCRHECVECVGKSLCGKKNLFVSSVFPSCERFVPLSLFLQTNAKSP